MSKYLPAHLLRRPGKLVQRLSLWYCAVFVISLFAAMIICYFSAKSMLMLQMDKELIEDVNELRELNDKAGFEAVKQEIRNEIETEGETSIYFVVFNSEGFVEYSSDLSSWKHINPVGSKAQSQIEQLRQAKQSEYLQGIYLENKEHLIRIVFAQIDDFRFIEIGESAEEQDDILEVLVAVFVVLFLVVTPVTAIGGWYVTRYSINDLHQVSDAAIRIKEGDLSTSVSISGNAAVELQELASTFNAMTQRIRSLVEEMREMTDNIAHDLRSPITRIRAVCEMALSYEKPTAFRPNSEDSKTISSLTVALEDTLIECDRLIFLINSTLELSQMESGIRQSKKELFQLSEMIEDVCDLYAPVAETEQIDLVFKGMEGSEFLGQKHNIQRMLTNLIDNAIKYSEPGGQIVVSLFETESVFTVKVSDQGIGIEQSEIDKIFNRFYRGEQERGSEGSGLGLSFSKAIALYHAGNIHVESTLGEGSMFIVEMPKLHS